MINEKVFLGYPIPFKDICNIYPPKVKDIVGNDEAIQWQALFTMSQEELDDAYRNEDKTVMTPNPFTYLLLMYYSEEDKRPLVLNGFKQLLHEPVTIIPEMEIIVIGVEEENLDPDVHLVEPRLLNAENYFDFQNLVRDAMGLNRVEPPDPDEDPRVARIKAKSRYREKVKAKKNLGPKFGTLLAAICCMGIGLNPLNIGEMSYANVVWLIEMYQQKEAYEIDIRSLLAGADSKKVKPKYWIKNLK
jgi:hypothetical protein